MSLEAGPQEHEMTKKPRKNGQTTPIGRPFEAGNPGRPKGTKDRYSKRVVLDILKSYDARGGVDYLTSLKDDLFAPLLKAILPKVVEFEGEVKLSPEDVIRMLGVADVAGGSDDGNGDGGKAG